LPQKNYTITDPVLVTPTTVYTLYFQLW